jgi:hypothetical protein
MGFILKLRGVVKLVFLLMKKKELLKALYLRRKKQLVLANLIISIDGCVGA